MSAARTTQRGVPATRGALRDLEAAMRHLEAAERLLLRIGELPMAAVLDGVTLALHHGDYNLSELRDAAPPRRRPGA